MIGALGTTQPAFAAVRRRGGCRRGDHVARATGARRVRRRSPASASGRSASPPSTPGRSSPCRCRGHPALLAEALPTAALAGVAGGALAALLAAALTGHAPRRGAARRARGRRRAGRPRRQRGHLHRRRRATADARARAQRPTATATVADVHRPAVRPDLGRDGNWAYVLGWQGGGRFHTSRSRAAPTARCARSARSRSAATWKSFARFQKGRDLVAAPRSACPPTRRSGSPASRAERRR